MARMIVCLPAGWTTLASEQYEEWNVRKKIKKSILTGKVHTDDNAEWSFKATMWCCPL